MVVSRLWMKHRTARFYIAILAGLVVVGGLALLACRDAVGRTLFDWTGEEQPLAQARALYHLAGGLTRPRPETAPDVPVAHAGLCPFGVNTFLEQEVEPAKVERAMQMIAEAGFCWVRQEFPWEDIEIHGQGDFEDRRHEPYRSAWDKYDRIVALAERRGLGLIVRLDNPPAWSRAAGDERGALAPPDDLIDYGDFVYAVVSRYRGRIKYYQIWNEPNIYPEWGEQPVDPEAYTALLKVGYTRAKEADPGVVIISGALASTIELDYHPHGLNDFIFLQRMYDAGAGDYFDVMAMQGYGLWSGPGDRRMRPRVLNFSRPLYVRDIMVANGDAHKSIWLSEMNWNAVPAGLPAGAPYGRVTPEQQARYVVEAYQRIQEEWPWLGVANFWYFKRADDRWKEEGKPEYYFRMVEPDFTPLPVYHAMKEYANRPPVMYPGYHQEDHRAVRYDGEWRAVRDERAVLGAYRQSGAAGDRLSFTFDGTALELVVVEGPEAGSVRVAVDGAAPARFDLRRPATGYGIRLPVAEALARGRHRVTVTTEGAVGIDGFVVARPCFPWATVLGVGALILALALGAWAGRRYGFRRGWPSAL